MNKLNNFIVQEFVPESIYKHRGDKAIECMDSRIVTAIDQLRSYLKVEGHNNPFTVNNWHIGGNRQFSGLRTAESKHYSPTSQHTFGRAVDVVTNTPIHVVHKHILDNPYQYGAINFIEIDIGWLHIDSRSNHNGESLRLWSPKRGFISVEQYRAELDDIAN